MYVGRIVAIGKTKEDHLTAMYRVSSRSFPNRQARQMGQAIAIIPKDGFETDIYKNPYIAYNGLRLLNNYAIVGNGTHTDYITEKLEASISMRDAMVSTLWGLDYEHDEYGTPRIAAVVDTKSRRGALGIVRKDAIMVSEFNLEKGEALYIATYEHNYPDKEFRDGNFQVASADGACDYVIGKGVFASLELPILAVCALESVSGFSVAFKDAGG